MIYKYKELFTPTNGLFKYMNFPFASDVTAEQLDTLFYFKFGNKKVTALITEMMVDGILPDANNEVLAHMIENIFLDKWAKLKEAIINTHYDATVITEYTEVINTSENGNKSNDDTNKTYGFNSSDGVNDTSSSSIETNSNTGEKIRTFKGRNGIFPQTVIEAEIRLRQKNLYLDYIMNDVNSIINLKIY